MALNLMRRIGETLYIGDDITIKVIHVKGAQVQLGIEAPKSIEIHREEIYLRIQEEKRLGIYDGHLKKKVAQSV